jgi:hypothetical protein
MEDLISKRKWPASSEISLTVESLFLEQMPDRTYFFLIGFIFALEKQYFEPTSMRSRLNFDCDFSKRQLFVTTQQ